MSLLINPFSPDFQADPYPTYHALRREDPVHRLEVLGVSLWVLTRYDDVSAALRDPRLSAAAVPRELLPPELADGNVFYKDPPDHTRLRSLIGMAYAPSVVEGLRPRITAVAEELLCAAEGRGEMDAISDYVVPLSITISAEVLGVPAADRTQLKAWSDDLTVLLDGTRILTGLAQAQRSAAEFIAYLREAIARRRQEPGPDLLSALIAARADGDRLREDELIATSLFTLVAGHETVTGALGNALLALDRYPDQLDLLRHDPSLIPQATEELLRYDPPVQLTLRTARQDLEIGGRPIKSGEAVCAVLGAANRDPAHFPDPDRLDLSRPSLGAARHLAFGHGPHHCVGAALGRLELHIALRHLLARPITVDQAGVERRPGVLLRGLQRLPLRLG